MPEGNYTDVYEKLARDTDYISDFRRNLDGEFEMVEFTAESGTFTWRSEQDNIARFIDRLRSLDEWIETAPLRFERKTPVAEKAQPESSATEPHASDAKSEQKKSGITNAELRRRVEERSQKSWYDRTGLLILLFFVFFPIAIYGLLRRTGVRPGKSAIILVVGFGAFTGILWTLAYLERQEIQSAFDENEPEILAYMDSTVSEGNFDAAIDTAEVFLDIVEDDSLEAKWHEIVVEHLETLIAEGAYTQATERASRYGEVRETEELQTLSDEAEEQRLLSELEATPASDRRTRRDLYESLVELTGDESYEARLSEIEANIDYWETVEDRMVTAWTHCQQAVEDRLQAPATASFPWGYSEYTEYLGNGTYNVQSYVDAENAFGAEMRVQFDCTVERREDGWVLSDIELIE